MNRDAFLTYIETLLAPTLSEGDMVVIDNLPAHKGEAVKKLPRAIESKEATAGKPDSSRTYYRQAERQPNCLGGMPPQLKRQSAGFTRLGAEGQRLAGGIPAESADR